MAAQGRKRPRVTEPVTAIVEGDSVGDVLLYDGRSYRIAEVYDGGCSSRPWTSTNRARREGVAAPAMSVLMLGEQSRAFRLLRKLLYFTDGRSSCMAPGILVPTLSWTPK